MSDKITGVCVDIPTIIKRAKVENTFTDQLYRDIYGITESAEVKEMFAGAHSEKPDGWISVAERLPEENVPVLGWDGIRMYESRLMEQEIIPFDINRMYEKRILIQDSDSGFMVDPILPITHWMKLPEPPK